MGLHSACRVPHSWVLQDGLTLTFDVDARMQVDATATGPPAHFVAGQEYRPECDLSCHQNWLVNTSLSRLQMYPARRVPCTDDVATFPPVRPPIEVNGMLNSASQTPAHSCHHSQVYTPSLPVQESIYTLELGGLHMYRGVEFGGQRRRGFSSFPADQRYPDPSHTSAVLLTGSEATSKCGEMVSGSCVCMSTCRVVTDLDGLEDAAKYRETARRHAERELPRLERLSSLTTLASTRLETTTTRTTTHVGAGSGSGSGTASQITHVPTSTVGSMVPTVSNGNFYNTTISLDGGGLPTVDLMLATNAENVAALCRMLTEGLGRYQPQLSAPHVWDASIVNPFAMRNQPIANSGLPVATVEVDVSYFAPPEWEDEETMITVLNLLLAMYRAQGLPRCGIPTTDLSDPEDYRCTQQALRSRAVVLVREQQGNLQGVVRNNLTVELTTMFRTVRGCTVLELASGVCGAGDSDGRDVFYRAHGGPQSMNLTISRIVESFVSGFPVSNMSTAGPTLANETSSADSIFTISIVVGSLVLACVCFGFLWTARSQRRNARAYDTKFHNPAFNHPAADAKHTGLVVVDVDSDEEDLSDVINSGSYYYQQATSIASYAEISERQHNESMYAIPDPDDGYLKVGGIDDADDESDESDENDDPPMYSTPEDDFGGLTDMTTQPMSSSTAENTYMDPVPTGGM